MLCKKTMRYIDCLCIIEDSYFQKWLWMTLVARDQMLGCWEVEYILQVQPGTH